MRSLFQPENHRERKLRICDRIRARAVDTRRPIANALELKLESLNVTDFAGDNEIYGQLIAYQRFQFEGKVS